jgi:hypothetical protein
MKSNVPSVGRKARPLVPTSKPLDLEAQAAAAKPWTKVIEPLRAFVDRARAHFRRTVFTATPFSQVKACQTFWWDGRCYIKETADVIFGEVAPGKFGPMARPFPIDAEVEI